MEEKETLEVQSVETMSLHKKMLNIADIAGVLRKTKEGFGYRYVPEEDIQANVTAGLQRYHVMLYLDLIPEEAKIESVHYEKYDNKIKGLKPVNEVMVSVPGVYTWVNVDNPEEKLVTRWMFIGQMEDAAQAFGAAMTYGNRYYLMKQLQLATTEADPDNYRSKQKEAEERYNKEEVAKLKGMKEEIVNLGSQMISEGVLTKEEVKNTVKKHNNDNSNPSNIDSMDVAEAILKEFAELAAKKAEKPATKGKKE